MDKELMVKLYDLIDEGVQIADNIRSKYSDEMLCIREVQSAISSFNDEKEIPKLVSDIMEINPNRRYELQKAIIAFMGEGKRLENSLIR